LATLSAAVVVAVASRAAATWSIASGVSLGCSFCSFVSRAARAWV